MQCLPTSLSLSAETSDHLNWACPPRVPPRTGSNISGFAVQKVVVGSTCTVKSSRIMSSASHYTDLLTIPSMILVLHDSVDILVEITEVFTFANARVLLQTVDMVGAKHT